jgi:prepilin-type processing-associated H-X9-DG protein
VHRHGGNPAAEEAGLIVVEGMEQRFAMAYSNELMTGGLPLELDYMLPGKPANPDMRESASIWLFEENGAFALPRNGIEAQGAVWDRHRFDCNFAFADGRVLRESTRADTRPSIAPDGRSNILGVGPFCFTCLEPFRKWRIAYDGEAYAGTVAQQIARQFCIYAEAGPYAHPRVPVAYDVEITMAAPAWVQDYRQEKLADMTEQQRLDAGSMGYGHRIEQLFRGAGTLTVDGHTRDFKAIGSRIHRQSVRPMAAFRGHCWQSAIFPDGRAFGYIAYPLRDGEAEEQRYNIGYIVQGGRMHRAAARKIPFLRNIMGRGDDVSLELESELGITRIGGTTELCTFHLGNPGTNGFNNQQSGVRYTLDGMQTFGMIERSSPAELCSIVG